MQEKVKTFNVFHTHLTEVDSYVVKLLSFRYVYNVEFLCVDFQARNP